VRGAKARRLLRLGGVLLLMLAPRGVGDGAAPPHALRASAPRPGLIPVVWSEPAPKLELEPPDLLALALRTQATPIRAAAPRTEVSEPVALMELALPAVGLGPPALDPVAEPPAGLLLLLAGPLAGRRLQRRKCGSRFSRKASMPSIASASSRLSAITAPASR
jgi:hypothetical protein